MNRPCGDAAKRGSLVQSQAGEESEGIAVLNATSAIGCRQEIGTEGTKTTAEDVDGYQRGLGERVTAPMPAELLAALPRPFLTGLVPVARKQAQKFRKRGRRIWRTTEPADKTLAQERATARAFDSGFLERARDVLRGVVDITEAPRRPVCAESSARLVDPTSTPAGDAIARMSGWAGEKLRQRSGLEQGRNLLEMAEHAQMQSHPVASNPTVPGRPQGRRLEDHV